MSGVVIRVLEKTKFEFTNLQDSAVQYIPVGGPIDVSRYREGLMVVRVHQANIGAAGATLSVGLLPTAPTAEDPAMRFWGGAETVVASAAITQTIAQSISTTEGYLLPTAFSSNFGGALQLVLTATQAGTATDLAVALSIDLVLKE